MLQSYWILYICIFMSNLVLGKNSLTEPWSVEGSSCCSWLESDESRICGIVEEILTPAGSLLLLIYLLDQRQKNFAFCFLNVCFIVIVLLYSAAIYELKHIQTVWKRIQKSVYRYCSMTSDIINLHKYIYIYIYINRCLFLLCEACVSFGWENCYGKVCPLDVIHVI